MRQQQLRAVLGYLHRVANPDGGGPDDAQLLDRWRNQGDAAAFEVLVWRHGAMVWNVCRRVLGRQQDVEDAFQATFLTFLRKADGIGRGQFLGSWLYKVAYRTALRARATSARHTVYEPLPAGLAQAAVSGKDDWDDVGPVLDEEVDRLPEKYRRPFVLCYLEGKTTDEAARDLGCPRGTVGTRLAWARERLRARLTRRGLALPAAGLATLLAEKAAEASVPAPLVASTVKAAICPTAGAAVAAGVISARAAALSQGVLQALFLTKLKAIALIWFLVGLLGSGAGLVVHQALAESSKPDAETDRQIVGGTWQESATAPSPFEVNALTGPSLAARGKAYPIDLPKFSATVVRLDLDGKGLGLAVPSKVKGEESRIDVQITDRTELLFSDVGPNEARLTEGYRADVWLDNDHPDVAACVHLRGHRNSKKAPCLAYPVVAVAADGQGITLGKSGKGQRPPEQIAIQLTARTRVTFSNVVRDRARMTVGYKGLVWMENDSLDTARSVTFLGTGEDRPAEGKDPQADRSGRIVGVSDQGKVLTVEILPAKRAAPTRTQIKLTDTTKESYHGIVADGAKPTEGYLVQVWLAKGSQDTAARVRFTRTDTRNSVDARILAVSADGGWITVDMSPKGKGGDPSRRALKITRQTRLVFSNVGPDGARLTEGHHVRGWLIEGSEDTADELFLSRPEKTDKHREDSDE